MHLFPHISKKFYSESSNDDFDERTIDLLLHIFPDLVFFVLLFYVRLINIHFALLFIFIVHFEFIAFFFPFHFIIQLSISQRQP